MEVVIRIVGPEHWGLTGFPAQGQVESNLEQIAAGDLIHQAYSLASPERKAVIDYLLSLESKNPGWVDSDARAYISALDSKARQWISNSHVDRQHENKAKTGS